MYACQNSSAVCGGDMADVLAIREVFTITFGGLTKQPFTIGGGACLAYARNPFSAAPCSRSTRSRLRAPRLSQKLAIDSAKNEHWLISTGSFDLRFAQKLQLKPV